MKLFSRKTETKPAAPRMPVPLDLTVGGIFIPSSTTERVWANKAETLEPQPVSC